MSGMGNQLISNVFKAIAHPTRIQILKLEKEEMVYSPEGLEIKRGEIEVETNKVEAETEIWKTSGMDQKTFNEGLQKIDSPDGESQDFENKELFLKFKAANTEAENHKNQNKGYYENIDAKQKEIDAREQSAGDLETPNENKILEALNSEKKEESQEKKEEEIPAKEENIAPSAEVANSEETIENSPVDVEEGVIDTKVNA